jgi:hypothetical protein
LIIGSTTFFINLLNFVFQFTDQMILEYQTSRTEDLKVEL